MSIVQVLVKSGASDEFVSTYALLDSGSTGTFCTERLMGKLKVTGKRADVLLKTMGNEVRKKSFVIPALQVAPVAEGYNEVSGWIDLPPVLSQPSLPVSEEDIATQEDLSRWDYLQEVRLPVVEKSSELHVGLLIGINSPKAMEPFRVIPSDGNGPFAVKTRLGWAINGPLGDQDREDVGIGSIVHIVQNTRVDTDLLAAVNRQVDYDFSERVVDEVEECSLEDKQFLESVEKSIEHKDGHYTIGLPFKDSDVKMPCNRSQAEQRLKHLEKRFVRDPDFHREYSEFMNKTIAKGYARKVPAGAEPKEGRLWYLPHHGVYHPQKKKLRVVFDCAARFAGTSLNDRLLSGPNLTNNLVGTLHRFRQGDTALVGDIEAMFCQVKVHSRDVDFLRFLWWEDGDVSKPPQEYQQMTHLFGATSSPAVVTYALLRTATDFEDQYGKEAADTLRRNCYVDDCIRSVNGVKCAQCLQKNLKGLTGEGGFNMNRWLSNARAVMQAIPEEEWAKEAKDLDLSSENLPTNCTLGAKGLLQELSRLKLAWDDPIPKELEEKWMKWKGELSRLSAIRIDRCFRPKDFGEVVRSELHHCPDARQSGYGLASFLRLVNDNGDVHCCLVTGKARVAPLKQVTIPHLELSAATVAVRVDSMLRRELDIEISESYFWTDSMSVLKYVANTSARFPTFLADRLRVIHEGSNTFQWHYIPTSLNPGDEASRGLSASEKNERWFHGPDFLHTPESEWPKTPEISPQNLETDPEVNLVSAVVTQ
ncbi:uncharacterized protein LOC135487824 [Lineus longissimus]|uniref:uncharacterized protein LOC135487824 n=1 Tax=Lineus longissimus TaxID=88925 RepID=UPI00315D45B5